MTQPAENTKGVIIETIIQAWLDDPKRTKTAIAKIAGCSVPYVFQTMQALDMRRIRDERLKERISERDWRTKPPVVEKAKPEPFRVLACQRFLLEHGDLIQCGAPSQGRTYCPACRQSMATKHIGSRYGYNPGFGPNTAKFAA